MVLTLGGKAVAEGDAQGIPGHGKINWTDRTITARGSGAPSKKAKSPGQARLMAERAAKLDAYRNILEAIKGVQVSSQSTGAEAMSSAEIKTKVEGVIQGARVIDTVYFSDMSVDIVLQMPIDGALTQALVPPPAKPAPVPTKGSANNSGLIVDAKGLNLVPAIAPKIVDEKGKVVYGIEYVAADQVFESGITGYAKDVDTAKKDKRVGEKPLVVKAVRTAKGAQSDSVIANADADLLRNKDVNLSFLSEGRVIVVID